MRSSHLFILGIVLLGVAVGVAWNISGSPAASDSPISASPIRASFSSSQRAAAITPDARPVPRSSAFLGSSGTETSSAAGSSARQSQMHSASAPMQAALVGDRASRISAPSSLPSSLPSSAHTDGFQSSGPAQPTGDTLTVDQQIVTVQAYERTPAGNALDIGVSPAAASNRPIAAGGFTLEEEQFRTKWGWVAFDQVQRAVRYTSTAN